MVYYKIPLADGVFDYPAGCILCCAYPYGEYMYCKFEGVSSVGSDWVSITESEFDVRCPDFPAPAEPPVQEAIAASATMADGSIVLTLPAPVDTGTLVKFSAPCACESVTGGIVIDGVTYSVVDATGQFVAGIAGTWASGAQVAVIIDNEKSKAYLQGTAPLKNILANSPLILVNGRDYGTEFPANPVKGQLFFKKV